MSRLRAALDALLDGGLDRRKVSALRLRRMRTLNILCVWMIL